MRSATRSRKRLTGTRWLCEQRASNGPRRGPRLGGRDLDDLVQPVADRIEHRADPGGDVMEERLGANDVRLGAGVRVQSSVVDAVLDTTILAVVDRLLCGIPPVEPGPRVVAPL